MSRRTPPYAIPNLQDALNRLIIPSQDSLHGGLTTPQDQMQVDVYGASPSSSILVESPATGASTSQEQMQEDTRQVVRRQRRTGWMSSTVSIGQDQAFNQVCDFLKDDEVGMVGIYGMGGVGKTTLMKKVRKEFLEPSNFKVIWIVVSQSIDVDSIQKDIIEEMNLPFKNDEHSHKCAERINKALAKNKVCLLFDDIWQVLDMELLGILGNNDLDTSKFKIIFTTRSKKVCNHMEPDKEIIVECLGWNDSWKIFEKCVGRTTIESDSSVSLLAKEVAKECKGLPLALTVIGRAMTCKYSPQEWKHALNMLQMSPFEVLDTEKNLFSRLKLSYDSLPDHGEKNCFLYCCLYPEDQEMKSSELVEYWTVEGFLGRSGSIVKAFNRGYDIIGTLRAACLLEKGKSDLQVKVHDVIRSMGLWILSELRLNYFVHSGSNMTNEEIIDSWREAHKIYVSKGNQLPEQPLCHNLTTLLIKPWNREIRILNGFFKSLRKVRVLQLWSVEFVDIPVAIGQMVELRYLSIRYTNLDKLPTEIRYLSKLMVLDLEIVSHLRELPEIIGQLVELRKLVVIPCPKAVLVELGDMSKLEIMSLKGIDEPYSDDHINFMNALRRLPHSLRRVDLTTWPINTWDEMLSALQILHELSSLRIRGTHFKELSILSSSYFSNLEELAIEFCLRLEKVQLPQPCLQNLRVLGLLGCTSLKYIFGLEHLQGLVELAVWGGKMKELIKADGEMEGRVCFHNLKVMTLTGLKNLKSICSDTILFPSLTSFFLEDCERLKKLPLGIMNGTLKAGEICGSRGWWDGLLWEDDGFKPFITMTLSLKLSSLSITPAFWCAINRIFPMQDMEGLQQLVKNREARGRLAHMLTKNGKIKLKSKKQILVSKNIVNADGQSSESVSNICSSGSDGSPTQDDSSNTSLN